MLTDEQRACIAWRCEHPKTGEDHRMVEISLGTLRTLLSAHADAVRLREAVRKLRRADLPDREQPLWDELQAALRPAEQGGAA